jgi:hypothetical protein
VQGNALNVQESPVDICPFNLYLPAMWTSSILCNFIAKLKVRW